MSDSNPYLAVINACCNDIAANQVSMNATMENERLLNSGFNAQNAVVDAAQQKLNELSSGTPDANDPDGVQILMGLIQQQQAIVQADTAGLNPIQNAMTQGFQQYIEPAEQTIQSDSILVGGLVSNDVATERV